MSTLRLPLADLRKCTRCEGTGTVRAHINVLGGQCFGCGGTGWVRNAPRVRPDTSVAVMTEWATGIVQVRIVPAGRVGVTEEANGSETTYTIPAVHFRAYGVDAARMDDDTDEARGAREKFRAAATRYGFN